MPQGADFDCDVLIIGLGPVGATLAALLARAGVRTIALDKDAEVYPLPRAAHFDHEIMRIFQQLGIAEIVERHTRVAPAYEFRTADGQALLRFEIPAHSPSGWAAGYMFHQPALEQALRDLLATLPAATMHTGWRYLSLDHDSLGVTATIETQTGRTTRRARYLVGCDGASSPVRGEVGGGMIDFQFDEPWLVIDARVLPGARTPEINLQICDPKRPTTCVLMGPGRHRWEFMLLPGETPEQALEDDFIQSLITPWDCGPVELERKAVYRFHGLMANRWRNGRVLLAGDSAHQMPPFAGQGMCSGLRDAANLAWKLQAVLAGAPEALLDTYQTERAPHVRAIIEQAIGMGRIVCTLDPVAASVRDRGMLAQQAAGARSLPPARPASLASGCVLAGTPAAGALFPQPTTEGRRLDDVLDDRAWLLSRTAAPRVGDIATAMTLEDASLAPFRKALTDWLDRGGVDAVLVRPDRYVFGTGDPNVLAAAFAQQVTNGTTPAPAPHGR